MILPVAGQGCLSRVFV